MAFFESHPDRVSFLKEQILDSWSISIPEAAGRGDRFLEGIEQAMKNLGVPDMTTSRIELEIVGDKLKGFDVRPALLVRATTEPNNTYHFYFSVQDFGKHLILSRFLRGIGKRSPNPFVSEIVTTYFALVNSATTSVAKQITEEVNQEFSKTGKPSSGVIDIT